jgi:hypothetical protein
MELLLDDIRVEIEAKVRSIDRSIIDLRREVQQIGQYAKQQQGMSDVFERLEKVEAEMQLLRYHQQFELKSSRAKSFDKERKPIFSRKDSEHEDFSSLVLGLESDSKVPKPDKRVLETKVMSKPPSHSDVSLPKPQRADDNVSIKTEGIFKKDDSKSRRSPLMEDSATIHRWLSENTSNSEFSCFNQIIREEDVEESVYY